MGKARSFEEQCTKGKYRGRFGKGGGTWRCQLKREHKGDHVDALNRAWPRGKREK